MRDIAGNELKLFDSAYSISRKEFGTVVALREYLNENGNCIRRVCLRMHSTDPFDFGTEHDHWFDSKNVVRFNVEEVND